MIIKPDYNLKSIYDIDLEELKSIGVQVMMFDLDSTIMISKSGSYTSETSEWLKKVKNDFRIAVISNNTSEEYIAKVKSISDFPVIGHASKPNPKKMGQFLDSIGVEPSQSVMVGDRPLTDIVAGKLLGCKTILVDSINAAHENLPTRFVRRLERAFIRGGITKIKKAERESLTVKK